jgi:hypothetical protein
LLPSPKSHVYLRRFIFFSSRFILFSPAEGTAKVPEVETNDGDEDGGWVLFGGSSSMRADNPLVHDPHFLRNQRHQLSDELGVFDHLSHDNNHRAADV